MDEVQDISKASLELILHVCHANSQVFFSEDCLQAIYPDAAPSFDSLNQTRERPDAVKLPSEICYRCESTIGDVTNQTGKQLICAELHKGIVQVIDPTNYLNMLKPGDAVIGRTTRYLVQDCLQTLLQGKKARVIGKNNGESIAEVVARMEVMRESQGAPALQRDLSNVLVLLDEYHNKEAESLIAARKNPETALAELSNRVGTLAVLFKAYTSKCHDTSLRVENDPPCAFIKTSTDFKYYIQGIFIEEEDEKDVILFMTAHHAKRGKWKSVYIICSEEFQFPHPEAHRAYQMQQERNLMYVVVTRTIYNLFFVRKLFSGRNMLGYEKAGQFIITPAPDDGHLSIPSSALSHDAMQRESNGNRIPSKKQTLSNKKADKKGRTQKERKNTVGRKTKSGEVRQPRL